MNPILLRSLRWTAVGLAGVVLVFSFALACTFVYLAPSLPTAENIERVQMAVPLRIYSRSGALVSQIGEQRRIPVKFEDIPLVVRQAVLAAEDDRFFEHRGLDWMGVARAVFKTAIGGSSQGGSTISQQAARNTVLTLDKTVRRKIAEIFVTWRMEQDFSKEQILATYLNVILFGQRSYGIAAAAETYYGKRLQDLSVAQAATLAGIIQLPSVQNPITSPKRAEARRSYVLRRMTELGYIDAATAAAAAKEPIASRGFAPLIDVEAPYVAEWARQELVERFGASAVNKGYKIITTLDDRRQIAANRAVRIELMNYDRRHGYRGPLGKVELPAAAEDADVDELLSKYSSVSMLEPAVVTDVAATTADVHVAGRGKARISWEGMKWAAKALRSGVGPMPRKAADVLKRGDVVYVIADGQGNAELAQLPEAQAALVALDPVDGAIVSMVGGFDFYSNQFNRATQANRQPGSGFKPFLYSAALEHGITPATVIFDGPVLVDENLDTEERWRPGNSDGKWLGFIPLRTALVRSRNTVSIRILQEIGMDAFMDHASRFGFDKGSMPRNQTLALGTLSVKPLQMATGFATFANGGFRVEPYFIERIEDATGEVVFQAQPKIACAPCESPPVAPTQELDVHAAAVLASEAGTEATLSTPPGESPVPEVASPPPPVLFGMDGLPDRMRALASVQGGRGYLPEERLAPRVISPQNAWLMSDIMHDVTTRGTAVRTRVLGRDDLAGKTGTTDEGRDNWFNGFTQSLVATVWVGYDDYRSLGEREEGSTTAVPIWIQYMREALKGTPSSRMPRPPGLIDARVSPYTGARADPFDPEAVVETFMQNHPPRDPQPGDADLLPAGVPGSTSSGPPTIF